MNRKVLLIEPDYKSKYPPMGLMKLATYYRMVGDDVRFYKGNMRFLAAELICEDLLDYLETILPKMFLRDYYNKFYEFIKFGRSSVIESDPIFKNKIVLKAKWSL